MGVFNIHPRGLSSITCGQMERENIAYNYQALPTTIDMNEGDRIKLTYASGGIGGMVNKAQFGLVKIKFVVAFKGATQAAAMANFRTFYNAISNPEGGYVEYRPKGLATNVLTSWYEYLQSSPPKLTRTGGLIQQATENLGQFGDSASKSVVLAQFELQTKAWVTSNPQSLVTIVSATTIQNRDDAGHDNHVTLGSSNIKGDAFLPVVIIKGPRTTAAARVLLYMRKMIVGGNTNLDYFEAEDAGVESGGWDSTQSAAAVSNGEYERTVYSSDEYKQFNFSGAGLNSTYFGKVAPIVIAKADSGSTFDCTISLYEASGEAIQSVTQEISGTSWTAYYGFGEMDLPPFRVPGHYDDDSSPTIGEVVSGNTYFRVTFTRTAGSGELDFDCVILAKASEWIGYADSRGNVINPDNMWFDSIDGDVKVMDGSDIFVRTSEKYGAPLSDMICMKGHDYRFRFFRITEADVISQANEYNVQIDGLYATIYPFETA